MNNNSSLQVHGKRHGLQKILPRLVELVELTFQILPLEFEGTDFQLLDTEHIQPLFQLCSASGQSRTCKIHNLRRK